MTPPEKCNTALALKRPFDCLLTPARLSPVLILYSASSRYERTTDPVALMCFITSSSMRRSEQ